MLRTGPPSLTLQKSLFACAFFIVLLSPALARVPAQPTDKDQPMVTTTQIKGDAPSAAAHIVKYFVDNAAPGSDFETGSLHILYDDGKEIIQEILPKKKSTEADIVENQEGFADFKLADDKRTIGWTETMENCCTSYAIPMTVSVYHSGKVILHIRQGQMVWYWSFRDGGKHIAAVWGFTHGPEVGDFQLYDAATGRMIAEVRGKEETQSLAPDAPEWAKQTEHEMNHQK